MHEQLFQELGALFESRGHELFLVGGSVRDIALGRNPKDWDFTTTALPGETEATLRDWADVTWDVGARFGTIACRKGGVEIEITTMRTDGPGRKPEVVFTTDLIEDLSRRDFTINAMAIRCDSDGLPDVTVSPSEIIDPFFGKMDLFLELLKTPLEPWKTFTEDPLRMLRAARFASQLGFSIGNVEQLAMASNRDLVKTVSAERIAAELEKTIAGKNPRRGLQALAWSGLLEIIAYSLDGQVVREDTDDIEVRWASAFGGKGGDWVTDCFKQLKMSNERIHRVSSLATMAVQWEVASHWWVNKDEVRRVLAQAAKVDPEDARGFLDKFLTLLDHSEATAVTHALLAEEGFPRAPLTGKEIMAHLGLRPGQRVGLASMVLWRKALDEGPVSKDAAFAALDEWSAVGS